MIEIVMIPDERKNVLIGKDGSVKKHIEKATNTKIIIEDGVVIEGESLDVIKAQQIVKAIGRGFSSTNALLLLDDEYQLIVISLIGETHNTIKRLFARVIGKDGRTRRKIEYSTGTLISVYGKTTSIIGKGKELQTAKNAVEQILQGRSHGYVYKRLGYAETKKEKQAMNDNG
jgi:ribosomal RNA assembly protein